MTTFVLFTVILLRCLLLLMTRGPCWFGKLASNHLTNSLAVPIVKKSGRFVLYLWVSNKPDTMKKLYLLLTIIMLTLSVSYGQLFCNGGPPDEFSFDNGITPP